MNPPNPADPPEASGLRDELFGDGAAGARSFFDQLLQHAPAPIYVSSLEGRYLFVNRAWEELTHVPFRQAVGRLTGEMFTPETARRLKEVNRRVLETGAPLHVEEVVEAADGTHYYHTVKFPVRNAAGALVAVGGVSIDVTERRRAEEAARAADARGRELLDGSPDGVLVVRNLQVAYVNQAFCDLLGYGRTDELVGVHAPDLVADACRARVAAYGVDRARGLPAPSCYEMEYLRRDGRAIPAEVHVRLIDVDGAPSSLAHVRDITERKKTEEALRGYAERLQGLSRRLLEVQEQERRRIARELHDEVGQILTSLHLSLERGGRLGEAALREAVGGACETLRDLTGRVRDLSLRLRPSMLDDFGLLPALLWHFERYTAQTGVRVAFGHTGLDRRFSPEGETAAYRIVQEALTNVARHAGVGEAAVRISLDRGALRLQIEDDGAGFDAAAVRRSGGGSGLSGMRQRVALLGGRLDVTSASGAGTRLTVEWPEGGGDGPEGGGG